MYSRTPAADEEQQHPRRSAHRVCGGRLKNGHEESTVPLHRAHGMPGLSVQGLQFFQAAVQKRVGAGLVPVISLDGEKVVDRVSDINDDPGLPGRFDFYTVIDLDHRRSPCAG